MSRDQDKDPWSTGIVRTPSPASSDADEYVSVNGFIQLSRDNDLAHELDLSRREDHAIVKESPFTLAKLRAQQQALKSNTTTQDERRSGGPIRTADGSDEPACATDNTRRPALKKPRVANTGWTDTNGKALDAGPIRKKGKSGRGEQSEAKGKLKNGVRKEEPASKPPVKHKTKRKTTDDDKVEFHKLPTITSHSDFPILAGLERQRSLPKKKPAKKDPPATASVVLSKPHQAKLDLDALISGYRHKPKVRAPPSYGPPSPADTKSIDLDLTAALNKQLGPLRNQEASKFAAQSKAASTARPPKALTEPFKALASQSKPSPIVSAGTRPHEIVDLTSPDPTIRESPGNKSISPDLGHVTSLKPLEVIQPIAVHHKVVQLLEELVEDHDPSAKFKHASRHPPLRHQDISRIHRNPDQPTQGDAEIAFLKRHSVYNRPVLDERPEDKAVQLETDNVFPSKQHPAWQLQDQQDAYGGHGIDRQSWIGYHEPSMLAQQWQQHDGDSRHGFADQDLQPRLGRSVDGLWDQEQQQSYDIAVRNQIARPASKEWSTLPPKRQRVTLHPDVSGGKSSKFRLPINLLSDRKLRSQKPVPPTPPTQSSPLNSESSLYTGGVTITKWTPRARTQIPAPQSTGASQREYVPSNMRALELMQDSSPEKGGYPSLTPQRSPQPHLAAAQRCAGSSSYQSQLGSIPYATPRSLARGPSTGPVDDDDDNWAAAWRLSANGR
ncbi:hypothetical protein CspeluHIS016_0901120 [Cutaneotrichosporon spelunceum]|uniref:Uncharacterized protein n=1 Tax=Cutaneotrichosporon spelunceum TaxID=1672016 RepID=A0AAD3TZU4_9TREE|nr:hypothetical protein CspeluHIS016_0901120 [Cutaneotrichosporon spelunceum]